MRREDIIEMYYVIYEEFGTESIDAHDLKDFLRRFKKFENLHLGELRKAYEVLEKKGLANRKRDLFSLIECDLNKRDLERILFSSTKREVNKELISIGYLAAIYKKFEYTPFTYDELFLNSIGITGSELKILLSSNYLLEIQDRDGHYYKLNKNKVEKIKNTPFFESLFH